LNPGHLGGGGDVLAFVPVSFCPKELWFWYHFSAVLSFLTTEVIFTGIQTQDSFLGVLTFLKYRPGFKVRACQVWWKLVYPFSSYK
jgi:hypothetical protein